MFSGKEKWLVYICLMLALVVNAVLIIKQLQYAYNLRMMYLTGEQTNLPVPDHQHIMLVNETFSKTFFLIFFCFWMILFGTLIFFTQSEKVYRSEYAHDVKLLWKATAPGIAMIIAGSLILAFSIYKYSDSRMVMNTPVTEEHLVLDQKILPGTGDTLVKQHHAIVKTNKKIKSPTSKLQTVPPPRQNVTATSAQEQKNNDTEVSEEDVQWAGQLANRVVKFGYYPTTADNRRYEAINKRLQKSGNTARLNDDMNWSLQLVQKMQHGYEPNEQEMKRLDEVNDHAASNAQPRHNNY